MNIYDEVSKILGSYITNDTLDREVKLLDTSGRITQRKLLEIILVIIKHIYKYEGNKSV